MPQGAPKSQTAEPPERLESWKEIAAHLKRDVRTVQRWEKTAAMPVHRHASEKVGTVYANRPELDAWFNSRRNRLDQQEKARASSHRRLWWAVAVAGIALTAAAGLWLRRPGPPSGMVARQVWASGADTFGAPSPDGRYLSFVDWETGDLAVRDLASDQNRRITNKGSWSESEEYAESSAVSPDSRQIAYAWFNNDNFYELRLIAASGGQPRVLFRDKEVFWISGLPAGRRTASESLPCSPAGRGRGRLS